MNSKYSLLAQELKNLCIVRRENVVLVGGQKSDLYFDVKKAYGYPKVRRLMAEIVWEDIKDNGVNCVAGSGFGGGDLATEVSSLGQIYKVAIRGESKGHGLDKLIEGYVPSEGDNVAIVDDVFTTGRSLKNVIEILKPTGANIFGCYVVVKRGEGDLPVPLKYLFEPDDLI